MDRPADQQPSRPEPLHTGLAAPRPFGDGDWSRGTARAHREAGTPGRGSGWWHARPALAAVPVALGLLAGTAYWLLAPASFQSSASVVVQPLVADQFGAADPAHLVDMATEVQLAQSSAVAADAGQRLQLSPDAVRSALDVQSPPGTEVLTVTFRAGGAAAAAVGAQAVADAYLAYREAAAGADADRRLASVQKQIDDVTLKLAQRSAPSASAYQDALRALLADQRTLAAVKAAAGGRVISKAVPPSSATPPKALVDIPIGGLAGVLVGVGLMLLPRSRRLATATSPRAAGAGRASGTPGRPGPGRSTATVTRPAGTGRPGTRSPAGSRPGPTSPSSTGLATAEPSGNRVISLAAGVPAALAASTGSAASTRSVASSGSAASTGSVASTAMAELPGSGGMTSAGAGASVGVPAQAAFSATPSSATASSVTAERAPVVTALTATSAPLSTPPAAVTPPPASPRAPLASRPPAARQQTSTLDEELIARYVAIAEQPSIIDGIEPAPVEPAKPAGPAQPWYRTDGARRRTPAADQPDELGVDLWAADPMPAPGPAHPNARAVGPRG